MTPNGEDEAEQRAEALDYVFASGEVVLYEHKSDVHWPARQQPQQLGIDNSCSHLRRTSWWQEVGSTDETDTNPICHILTLEPTPPPVPPMKSTPTSPVEPP